MATTTTEHPQWDNVHTIAAIETCDAASTDSNDSADPVVHFETPEEPHCFEGPEKNLEVCFRPGVGPEGGCRNLSREQLDVLLTAAKCTILSKMSNHHLDAYVLSESSLFVYPYKMILKTCGTTTLLRCLAVMVQMTSELGMELEWVGYSRKNYTFPGDQMYPHSSFDEEMTYLRSHTHLSERLHGSGYLLGPLTGDHWFVYVCDNYTRPSVSTDVTINLMMFDMAPEVAQQFYKSNSSSARDVTTRSGISHLVPGATIDDFAFEPCGYSMNAILHNTYTTIHVTPQPHCSYASFETNSPLRTYTPTVRNVLNIFKPRRFVLTVFADEGGLKNLSEHPLDQAKIIVPQLGMFVRSNVSSTRLEKESCCFMGNYVLCEGADPCASPSDILRRRGLSIC